VFRRMIVRLTVALVAALAGLVGVTGSATAGEPAPDQRTARYEVDFLTGMIDHHTMAVHMAMMCQDKAVHDELRQMCEDIAASQQQEIETMQGWLGDWYGVTYAPEMRMDGRMKRLMSASGGEFEVLFMESMIRHHTRAVREAQACQERAYHPELVQMCDDIESVQVREIETMSAWLCEWYDRCRFARRTAA